MRMPQIIWAVILAINYHEVRCSIATTVTPLSRLRGKIADATQKQFPVAEFKNDVISILEHPMEDNVLRSI
jgi:hypothetical protein